MAFYIEFEPVGRRGECPEGKSLLECARYLGVGLVSICGGFGKCKACKVCVVEGSLTEPGPLELEVFSADQIREGWRLACLAFPQGNCKIYVPPESLTTLQRMQVESQFVDNSREPAVKNYSLELQPPNFGDLRSDATRLLETLEEQREIECKSIDIEVMRNFSPKLRSGEWKTEISVRNDEVIALNAPGSRHLGLAMDVGTTKIAGYLMDLEEAKTLASKGLMNPQISYGEDITSRIHHALKKGEAGILRDVVVEGLNQLAEELCEQAGASITDIEDAVLVGNTAIDHLFLGLPVDPLAYPPFVAAVQDAIDLKARDFGLKISPGAYVHVLPNIAGFVGADHVSMLVAIDALSLPGLTLAIDIGTNTEVSLIDKERIFSASCASGPAFEGGHISNGMRAASGAIERLRIENSTVQFETIDDITPIGICGSGIIDSVAQMYLAGILNEGGRMQEGFPGVRRNNEYLEFVLFQEQEGNPAVVITQRDVREVQLGKAAIRAGIQVLEETADCDDDDIEQVLLAGAFGTYIDIGSAIDLGMLPAIPPGRYKQVGNAAGMGARQTLLSVRKRALEQSIAERIRYIELAGTPSFNKTFIQTQYLGRYRIQAGKRLKI
ncbi:MAG: DUF4445 domain-containing protein [Dehalococcoidales bacterium]|nr:DUF4445 domain-containing protein [Dehalococcoidales bacterium]